MESSERERKTNRTLDNHKLYYKADRSTYAFSLHLYGVFLFSPVHISLFLVSEAKERRRHECLVAESRDVKETC